MDKPVQQLSYPRINSHANLGPVRIIGHTTSNKRSQETLQSIVLSIVYSPPYSHPIYYPVVGHHSLWITAFCAGFSNQHTVCRMWLSCSMTRLATLCQPATSSSTGIRIQSLALAIYPSPTQLNACATATRALPSGKSNSLNVRTICHSPASARCTRADFAGMTPSPLSFVSERAISNRIHPAPRHAAHDSGGAGCGTTLLCCVPPCPSAWRRRPHATGQFRGDPLAACQATGLRSLSSLHRLHRSHALRSGRPRTVTRGEAPLRRSLGRPATTATALGRGAASWWTPERRPSFNGLNARFITAPVRSHVGVRSSPIGCWGTRFPPSSTTAKTHASLPVLAHAKPCPKGTAHVCHTTPSLDPINRNQVIHHAN